MFTGIITEVGTIRSLTPGGVARIELTAPLSAKGLTVGGSVAVNGACLTAVEVSPDGFIAEAMNETMRKTNLGKLTTGAKVNLEPALQLGARLDGHLVAGHVDGTVRLTEKRPDGAAWRLELLLEDEKLARYIAPKGSVTLDGVSLTVIEAGARRFSVGVIPHTASVTTIGAMTPGRLLNLEVDLLARYLDRLQLTTGMSRGTFNGY
ncbi:riboflavin synthase [bacterium]|nr:riboflavin synthase [bacterium]